jgi:S-adenosylmethionine:tRNA ribosyltransferase-isomerase
LQLPQDFNYVAALTEVMNYLETTQQDNINTKTQLLIAPGYNIRSVKGIITNFHQPNSTLLLLVAALVGDNWKEIYNHALASDYRFLSYGDGSLLLRYPLA